MSQFLSSHLSTNTIKSRTGWRITYSIVFVTLKKSKDSISNTLEINTKATENKSYRKISKIQWMGY